MSLNLEPLTLAEASAFVRLHHRHHEPPRGCVAVLGASNGERIVGVAIIGRPVARMNQDGRTAELTRLCTDGTRNAASFLAGRAWRAARALGYRRLLTYTLRSEGGASMRAAGFRLVGVTPGGSWSRRARPRVDKHPTQGKLVWSASTTNDGGKQP